MLQFNDVYRGMLGYDADELHRMTFAQVTPERWHAEEARVLEETVRARRPLAVYEKEYVRKDGTVFPVEVRAFVRYQDGEPVGMWGIVRDITRERAIRAQLATASRLAALGTLVAGVAHEINNPLGGVLASHGFVAEEIARIRDALRSGEPIDAEATARRMDEVGEALADAQAGEKRIAAIVRDLALLGRPEAARVPVALARVVDDALRWLPRSLADRVDLTVENAGAPEVVAAEGQIAQVVVNLVANAARAIPSSRKGRVRIRTGSAGHGKALVEVTDDGVGMSPEVMRRMFDPFYTTRETGQGMGLGLAISHAIVSAHGGTISASSVPGEGSTFLVELPSA
jgi:PAS domain S-box-containing protein